MWRKILIGTSGVLVLLIISAVLFLNHLIDETCGNQVFSEIVSPGKKYKAMIFQRDCGATTGFSTQISILEAGDSLGNSSGNIYIVDGAPAEVAPEVKWLSDQNLTIRTENTGSEFKAEKKWGMLDSVEINYSASGS